MSTMKYRDEERKIQKDNRTDEILDITMASFLSVGVEQTKMSDIAAKAKISRKTLYQYFSSKEKIALQIELKVFTIYVEKQNELIDKLIGNGYEQLEQYFKAIDDFINEYQELIRFTGIFDYYFSGDYEDEGFYNQFLEIVQASRQVLMSIIEKGMQDGSIVSDIEPLYLERTLADSILALAQRVTSRGQHLDEEHQIHSRELVNYQMRLFLKAVKA